MSGPATPQALHDMLRKIQEPKGYFFNKDMDMTMPLLESLLVNRQRYGYMACPCRLSLGEFEKDRDIVCPCVYREDDVKEYGACFCGLYVSQAWNDDEIPHDIVPERRPPEKLFG
ncbi:ferredoxin:thioredoxin reductase [Desulfovibrio oxamicus]|uniref:ferredoxin:thioredoxin reductase n=1 Tax=Nitratidesulfovibrio oxamicus TaxID=32016 RepID=A0ABS0J6G1_9BACT|nr:ferredoxin-thioredoxin reductase catalytic domain-containing protein [Nitratidesulfovibrio oxamicus]MBG3877722.1 ferredoxin:thioredoxin reductase [Nitratidesulfovibrio oxamicus]